MGVLTFHRCINYGSYWQTRCLLDGLRARGHDAIVLDHRSRQATWAEWRCAFQPLLPTPTPRTDYPFYGAKARRLLKAVDRLPRSTPFLLESAPPPLDQDVIVVGSDEVWNLAHPWYGGQSLFFGAGLGAARMVSYAASFGNYDAAAGLEPQWAERLHAFDAISVRDENSRRIVGQALSRDPEVVLDPVLQFPPALPAGEDEPNQFPDRPYVVVYGHGFPTWFAPSVRGFAAATGQTLISVGYRNDWADEQHLAASPGMFARLIAGATAVATNFFHGCVFALLNEKPFACVSSPYRANKISDLMSLLGERSRLVDERSWRAVPELLKEAPASGVFERIRQLRDRSHTYLDRALV